MMNFLNKFKKNLKYIKPGDIRDVIFFILIYPITLLYRLLLKIKKQELWLICESTDTARDNGYHFYKYLKNKHSEVLSYYAIEKDAIDRKKIERYGNIINYGSIRHWIYYLSAKENISTQKAGNPASALFYILHIYEIIRNNRTFLQHGITKDNAKWLYYNETKFKTFICGAKKEYDYIKNNFGYPENNVVYTGFARYDNLINPKVNEKQILIMPTWRNWLARATNILDEDKQEFSKTKYFKKWSSLLKNEVLLSFLDANDMTVYFYPHYNMQRFANLFKTSNARVKIVKKEDIDIQTLLKESALLITDYSSVFFDFAYIGKPIIHYQFDEKEFRSKQYEEGYFSYRNDGFGDVLIQEDDIINKIMQYAIDDFRLEDRYIARMNSFFVLKDKHNSERIYNAIVKNKKKYE